MRAWILDEQKWGTTGARRFVAEWYEPRPGADPDDENGDPSDQFVTKRAAFPTKERAIAKARTICDSGRSFFGEVEVYEQVLDDEYEDGVAEWKHVGHPEIVS